MADDNPFLNVGKDETGSNPFAGVGATEKTTKPAIRQEPLTNMERMAFQNLFDTQPERRKAYARSIGLELDPDDENKFRAMGDTGPYDNEVDPFIGDQLFQAKIMRQRGPLSQKSDGLIGETGKDITDLIYDLGPASMATTAGAGIGAAKGAAAGPVGAFLGAVFAGGAGNYAAEELKAALGDTLLDEDIPLDRRQALLQSSLVGIFAGGPAAIKEIKKKGLSVFLNRRRDAVKEILKSQGKISDEAIEKAVAKPELFDPVATKNANKKFIDFYKTFFGLDPDADLAKKVQFLDGPPADSVIGKTMEPIRAARDAAVDQLSTNPAAQMSYSEAAQPIVDKIKALAGNLNKTPDEKEALGILQEQLSNLTKMAERKVGAKVDPYTGASVIKKNMEAVAGDPAKAIFSFRELNDFKRGLQGNAFKETAVGSMSENPIVGQLAGEFRSKLDDVATKAGSNFADLNAKLHKGLETFKVASSNLKPTKMVQSFITGPTENALETRQILSQIDEVTGQNFTQQFEDGALSASFEKFFEKPAVTGSSQVNKAITKSATEEATKMGAAGTVAGAFLPGVGPTTGGLIGAGIGAMKGANFAAKYADPATAIRELGTLGARITENALPTPQASRLSRFASQQLGRSLIQAPDTLSQATKGMSDAELQRYMEEQERLRQAEDDE